MTLSPVGIRDHLPPAVHVDSDSTTCRPKHGPTGVSVQSAFSFPPTPGDRIRETAVGTSLRPRMSSGRSDDGTVTGSIARRIEHVSSTTARCGGPVVLCVYRIEANETREKNNEKTNTTISNDGKRRKRRSRALEDDNKTRPATANGVCSGPCSLR